MNNGGRPQVNKSFAVERRKRAHAAYTENRSCDDCGQDSDEALVHQIENNADLRALLENGERQLGLLQREDIQNAEILLGCHVTRTNYRLRNGLKDDWCELHSYFERLGNDLILVPRMKVYRGIRLLMSGDVGALDGNTLENCMTDNELPSSPFIEKGYSFASTSWNVAAAYATKVWESKQIWMSMPSSYPVVFELDANRALCIPHACHLSAEIFEKTFELPILNNSMCQVIFDRESQWEITGIRKDSARALTIVSMTQLPEISTQTLEVLPDLVEKQRTFWYRVVAFFKQWCLQYK